MSKAKTERYDVTVQGGGHGMTTDPLDGLEQLRRIIDEQPEPAPESVMLGLDYCYAEWVAERARHAEEVSALRDQLRKVEGERDVSRRQCGELHEHLALIVRYFEEETSEGDGIAEQHWAGYQLAKIVLVRTAPNEAAWETAMVEFAQLQERASKFAGAQHEIEHLRDQIRKVEGERDALAVRMDLPASQLLMVGSELCGDGKIDPNDHRDPRWTPTLQRAAEVMRELTARRAHDEDVRTCLEYCDEDDPTPGGIGGLARELLEWFSGRAA